MQKDMNVIHSDGGSRGNPGPAACGIIIEIQNMTPIELSKYLGVRTNNEAEYEGVILALEWLVGNSETTTNKEIIFLIDSELVVNQLNGKYKIKKAELQLLVIKIRNLIEQLNTKIFFKHIPREENKIADFLVNKELDKKH
jgi:ribonuclease HI